MLKSGTSKEDQVQFNLHCGLNSWQNSQRSTSSISQTVDIDCHRNVFLIRDINGMTADRLLAVLASVRVCSARWWIELNAIVVVNAQRNLAAIYYCVITLSTDDRAASLTRNITAAEDCLRSFCFLHCLPPSLPSRPLIARHKSAFAPLATKILRTTHTRTHQRQWGSAKNKIDTSSSETHCFWGSTTNFSLTVLRLLPPLSMASSSLASLGE